MTSMRVLITRIGLFAAVMGLLLVAVVQTIDRPVGADTDAFTAMFTDANGLKPGDDVRVYGVRVGTVAGLALKGDRAEVRFALRRDRPLYDNSTLAIRYQNLTGQRYVDVQHAAQPTGRLRPGAVIGIEHTVPAFDVTTLFNGLQPVLAELTPADLNQFSESLLAVVQGDGSGIGPAFDAIEKLSRYAVDRQQLISTLIRNLAMVSGEIGGKSPQAVSLLEQLTVLFDTLQQKASGLIDFGLTFPPVLVPARDLLAQLGLTGDPNPYLTSALDAAFPDPAQAREVLRSLPGLLQSFQGLIPQTGPNVDLSCSRGSLALPAPFQILVAGQKVSLCNP
ncbi:MCE family protein [Nocardia sp. NPDC058379]|uniref:MCE family protein n=1 Tax=unclassified Nocardia TaxID=2637762 RepID=UPI0036662D09